VFPIGLRHRTGCRLRLRRCGEARCRRRRPTPQLARRSRGGGRTGDDPGCRQRHPRHLRRLQSRLNRIRKAPKPPGAGGGVISRPVQAPTQARTAGLGLVVATAFPPCLGPDVIRHSVSASERQGRPVGRGPCPRSGTRPVHRQCRPGLQDAGLRAEQPRPRQETLRRRRRARTGGGRPPPRRHRPGPP
jgi:hypothetical protein